MRIICDAVRRPGGVAKALHQSTCGECGRPFFEDQSCYKSENRREAVVNSIQIIFQINFLRHRDGELVGSSEEESISQPRPPRETAQLRQCCW